MKISTVVSFIKKNPETLLSPVFLDSKMHPRLSQLRVSPYRLLSLRQHSHKNQLKIIYYQKTNSDPNFILYFPTFFLHDVLSDLLRTFSAFVDDGILIFLNSCLRPMISVDKEFTLSCSFSNSVSSFSDSSRHILYASSSMYMSVFFCLHCISNLRIV